MYNNKEYYKLIQTFRTFQSQRNQFLSKWNLIFTKNSGSAWISFKPQLGLHVYPCYACRDMFASKVTFQDHINRRAILIKYECSECNRNLTFFNRCSFLLHARSHFSLIEGQIDLNKIDVFSLPFGMMGFLPHPGVIPLFDVEGDIVEENVYINTQFYSPDISERGKQIVLLKPNDLLFCSQSKDSAIVQLTLKQISNNIPNCQFITLEDQKKLKESCPPIEGLMRVKEEIQDATESLESSVPFPPPDDNYRLPIISKIESLSSDAMTYPKCPECKETQRASMKSHFVGKNLPFDENLRCSVCRYVASTKCSFSAHIRIHANIIPFICPECGKKFETREYLLTHLEDVCFHLAKQVRIRCPGKKCGKLFASIATFKAHFAQHLNTWLMCTVCKEYFTSKEAFSEHAKVHSNLCFSEKHYHCAGCRNEDGIIFKNEISQHIQYHCTDRTRFMYVFICKFCKNYFRSPITFANHLTKCQKISRTRKSGFSFTLDSCFHCNNRIIFYENEVSSACSKCRHLNFIRNNDNNQPKIPEPSPDKEPDETDVNVCLLCKKEISDREVRFHPLKCIYRNPQIVVQKLSNDELPSYEFNSSDNSNDSSRKLLVQNSEQNELSENSVNQTIEIGDTSPKSDSRAFPKTQEILKRKRKKAPLVFRGKKQVLNAPVEESVELQAEEPKPFDGTYYCKLCSFNKHDREEFHHHIKTHRDVSTAYQCMECGECFVVKPSLLKHLMHYHKIEDTAAYMEINECFDKNAVKELQEIMKLAPGESREPVEENQCRVCREQFPDSQELRKHFRIHGMAFLMEKSRE